MKWMVAVGWVLAAGWAPVWAQDEAVDGGDDAAGLEAASEAPKFDFATHLVQLDGAWDGALTYRDFQSNRQVTLPMTAQMTAAGDGSYVAGAFTFTDPGYQVFSHTVLQPVGSTGVRVADFGGGEMTLAVRVVTSFTQTEDGFVVVYEEQGRDDGEPATLRHTETLAGDRYTLRRDVRGTGEDAFVFRNEIQLDRVSG